MMRYIRLYNKFFQQYIKVLIEYRASLVLGLIGFLLVQFTGIIFIQLIFNSVPTLDGWGFYEILFIYGMAQIPRGIDHVFTDYLWIFTWKTIVEGEFDRYLLRPLNPLFQVISESVQPDGLGEIIIGVMLTVYSSAKLGIQFGIKKLIILVVVIIFSTIIYSAIKLAVASIAFWTKSSFSYLFMTYQISSFAKYPIGIYPKVIKFILIGIIPFAFTGYYPAAYFIGKESFQVGVLLTVIISLISITVAYKIWTIGIRSYESAGS
ncbi:ABC transporter permease [Clostridium butyricum]|uniref:ABC transporter permease n=1 Tax=Clostridium butyricum TaxID=1492 RepID=UPI002AB20E7A|nr:ABC-2 family transporter protein [Clostridium butyricum]